jgi:hypothetical protein
MQDTFETFWNESAVFTTGFTNALLPPGEPVMEVLGAASVHPPVADAFMRCFDNPRNYFPWITDVALARAFVAERTVRDAA